MDTDVPEDYLDRITGGENPRDVMHDFFKNWGDDDYVNSFDELCLSAGSPDEEADPTYSVSSVTRRGEELLITCEVFFDEVIFGGGCADMSKSEPRSGEVEYVLHLPTGKLSAVREDYK